MPRPPPPATALTNTGKPTRRRRRSASATSADGALTTAAPAPRRRWPRRRRWPCCRPSPAPRGRADEGDAGVHARLGQVRVLGQEPVARVDRVRAGGRPRSARSSRRPGRRGPGGPARRSGRPRSAFCRCTELRSSHGNTATESMPSSQAARNARTAISPRLATRILENIAPPLLLSASPRCRTAMVGLPSQATYNADPTARSVRVGEHCSSAVALQTALLWCRWRRSRSAMFRTTSYENDPPTRARPTASRSRHTCASRSSMQAGAGPKEEALAELDAVDGRAARPPDSAVDEHSSKRSTRTPSMTDQVIDALVHCIRRVGCRTPAGVRTDRKQLAAPISHAPHLHRRRIRTCAAAGPFVAAR